MRLFVSSLSSDSQEPITEQLVIDGLTYPNSLGLQDPTFYLVVAIFSYQGSPKAWTIQDKTFIAVTTEDSDLNKGYVVVYDHFRGMVSDPVYTGITSDFGDIHHFNTVIQSSENKLLSMQDIAHGNTRLEQATSPDNFQVNGTWSVRNQSETTYDSVYPHTYRFNDGSLVDVRRRARIIDQIGKLEVYSATTGATWTKIGDLINWSDLMIDEFTHVPYAGMMYSDDEVLRVWINDFYETTSYEVLGWVYLFYMESHDKGLTWQNAAGTYSKNISTNGAITGTECIDNYVVIDQFDGVQPEDGIRANSGCYNKDNGHLYITTAIKGINTPNLAVWNGTSWSVTEIVCNGYTFQSMTTLSDDGGNPLTFGSFNNTTALNLKSDGLHFYGGYFAPNGTYGIIGDFLTTNEGQTWTHVGDLTPTDVDCMVAQLEANVNDRKVFACQQLDHVNEKKQLYIGEL